MKMLTKLLIAIVICDFSAASQFKPAPTNVALKQALILIGRS